MGQPAGGFLEFREGGTVGEPQQRLLAGFGAAVALCAERAWAAPRPPFCAAHGDLAHGAVRTCFRWQSVPAVGKSNRRRWRRFARSVQSVQTRSKPNDDKAINQKTGGLAPGDNGDDQRGPQGLKGEPSFGAYGVAAAQAGRREKRFRQNFRTVPNRLQSCHVSPPARHALVFFDNDTRLLFATTYDRDWNPYIGPFSVRAFRADR